MAGTSNPGEATDNPVPINVTAMVDIIFCLSIFFMCAFHFRQLEGKMACWLPAKGESARPAKPVEFEEVRISLRSVPGAGGAAPFLSRRVGPVAVGSDGELSEALRDVIASYVKAGIARVPAVIDADPSVPWSEVVNVLGLCRAEGIRNLEFAARRT
jgi:biopolymer transport protein ExbD